MLILFLFTLITMCVVWMATGGNWHPSAHFSKLSDEMDGTLSLSDSGPQVSCSTPLVLCLCLDRFLPDFFKIFILCVCWQIWPIRQRLLLRQQNQEFNSKSKFVHQQHQNMTACFSLRNSSSTHTVYKKLTNVCWSYFNGIFHNKCTFQTLIF